MEINLNCGILLKGIDEDGDELRKEFCSLSIGMRTVNVKIDELIQALELMKERE